MLANVDHIFDEMLTKTRQIMMNFDQILHVFGQMSAKYLSVAFQRLSFTGLTDLMSNLMNLEVEVDYQNCHNLG